MKVMSVHYPKAGGTSLRTAFDAAKDETTVTALYDDDPVDPDSVSNYNPVLAALQGENLVSLYSDVIIHSHLPPRKFKNADFDIRISIIRQPVAWLISLYNFWSKIAEDGKSGHKLFEKFRAEKPSIVELASFPYIRDCMSKTYFGGTSIRDFDYIGSQEDYVKTVHRISALLEIQLVPSFMNVSKPFSCQIASTYAINSVNQNKLERILKNDIEFYDAALNHFE